MATGRRMGNCQSQAKAACCPPAVGLGPLRGRPFKAGLALLLGQIPREVIEDAKLIAIEVGDAELAQAPRFVLGLGEDLGSGLLPTLVQFVDFLFAVEIQPDHHPASGAVVLVERSIGQEHPAVAVRDAANPPGSSPQSKLKPRTLT
jgi:hypothetical protein